MRKRRPLKKQPAGMKPEECLPTSPDRQNAKRQRIKPNRKSVAASDAKISNDRFHNASEFMLGVDDMDLSTVALGVLLNLFLLRPFKNESGEETLYRGKVVSYLVPPTNVSDGRLLQVNTLSPKRRDHKPLDYALYRIHFDDGDQCDMDPLELYEYVMLYDQQVRTANELSSATRFLVF